LGAIVCAVALIRRALYFLQDTSLSPADGISTPSGEDSAFHEQMSEHGRSNNGSLPLDEELDIELSGQM